jgi:phosphoglycolate phosphatase-like HAD superfamily hydrolase
VVVIGDTIHDVSAGRANGFLTAAVATGWSPGETLEKAEPDRVFDDLTPENGFEAWLAGEWRISLETDPV